MPKVAINLATWNGQKYIEDCLDSVFKQTCTDFLLLIIDNGSVDQTAKIIEEKFLPVYKDKIRFIKNKENLGFARAHNQALLWTDSEYVLVLNQDVILEQNYVESCLDFLEKNKDVASVTGKILRWDFVNSDDWKIGAKTDIIDSLGLRIYKRHEFSDIGAGQKDSGQHDKITEVFGISGACAFYRRKALEDVRYKEEYFDNDFFSYKEDVDLAYRLRWRSWQSFYLPQAVCFHHRSAVSLDKKKFSDYIKLRQNKSKFVGYYSYRNHLFLLVKNLSLRSFWHCFFSIKIFELKKFIYLLLSEPATLAGYKDFFSKLKIMRAKRKFIMSRRLIKDEDLWKWLE